MNKSSAKKRGLRQGRGSKNGCWKLAADKMKKELKEMWRAFLDYAKSADY